MKTYVMGTHYTPCKLFVVGVYCFHVIGPTICYGLVLAGGYLIRFAYGQFFVRTLNEAAEVLLMSAHNHNEIRKKYQYFLVEKKKEKKVPYLEQCLFQAIKFLHLYSPQI